MDRYRERASLRNLFDLSLSTAESTQIACALDDANARLKREGIGDVRCPLPLPLQDLCLLVIVSDLPNHQVDFLSSLPRWLRQRLLNVLPALDLGRLEHTPITADVDVEPIWNSKCKDEPLNLQSANPWRKTTFSQPNASSGRSSNTPTVFQLSISRSSTTLAEKLPPLMEEVNLALKNVKQIPEGKASLLTMASEILKKYPEVDMNEMIHRLISIRGDIVFSSLLASAIPHESCKNSQCGQQVWKKQATALAVNVNLEDYSIHSLKHQSTVSPAWKRALSILQLGYMAGPKMVNSTYLTPHRLLLTLYRYNPLEVLSLLTRDCSLQPSTAYLHIDSICQTLLSELCSETLALDSHCSLASDGYSAVLNHFLEKVIVLSLSCDSYSHVGILVNLIDGVAASQDKCQLKHLTCKMLNLYVDVVKSLSALFSLSSFCQLTLDVNELNPVTFCKLLQEFMTIPCSHTQKLMIQTQKDSELLSSLPKTLQENQVARLKGNTRVPLPSSSAQHKELEFSSQKEYTCILQLLLQLPSIRIKEIVLEKLDEHPEYLHFCAIHPDLHTTKLTIDLSKICGGQFSASRQSDLITLFQMTSLQELCLYGNWGTDENVKLCLVDGLRSRNQSFPLTQLALMLETNNSYKMSDLQTLCDAIFSLPQLENLDLILGKGFGNMFRQPGYEQMVYRSWRRRGANVQLKSIRVSGYASKSQHLSLITKEYSNVTPLRDVRRPMYNKRYSLEDFFFFDDEYYGYDDVEYYGGYNYYSDDSDY